MRRLFLILRLRAGCVVEKACGSHVHNLRKYLGIVPSFMPTSRLPAVSSAENSWVFPFLKHRLSAIFPLSTFVLLPLSWVSFSPFSTRPIISASAQKEWIHNLYKPRKGHS